MIKNKKMRRLRLPQKFLMPVLVQRLKSSSAEDSRNYLKAWLGSVQGDQYAVCRSKSIPINYGRHTVSSIDINWSASADQINDDLDKDIKRYRITRERPAYLLDLKRMHSQVSSNTVDGILEHLKV